MVLLGFSRYVSHSVYVHVDLIVEVGSAVCISVVVPVVLIVWVEISKPPLSIVTTVSMVDV